MQGMTENATFIAESATAQAMTPPAPPTVLGSWVRVLVTALRERGIDADALLERAGLDTTLLAMPDARFPLATTTRLWRLASQLTRDPAIGLWVSKHSRQTTFHALGYAFMASSTLLEALQRVVRFNGMVSDASEVSLHDEGDCHRLSWRSLWPDNQPTDEAMEAILALILRSCRKIHEYEFAPVSTSLMRAEPPGAGAFRDFFRGEVLFGEPAFGMSFRKADLERRLPWGNEELARSNDRVIAEYLARLEIGSIATRLGLLLVKQLPNGEMSQDYYAAALAMSPRSLQRKLDREGTSFNRVLNETRCELARSYLARSAHTLTEIAFLLGFSDTSSFSRAFARWTGSSPSAYRDGALSA